MYVIKNTEKEYKSIKHKNIDGNWQQGIVSNGINLFDCKQASNKSRNEYNREWIKSN